MDHAADARDREAIHRKCAQCTETRPEAFRACEPYRCKACRLAYNRVYQKVQHPRVGAPAVPPPPPVPIPAALLGVAPPDTGGLWPDLVAAELDRLEAQSWYCPMCNTRTSVAVERIDPFRIVTCAECGHIHTISEPRRAPVVTRVLWDRIAG